MKVIDCTTKFHESYIPRSKNMRPQLKIYSLQQNQEK